MEAWFFKDTFIIGSINFLRAYARQGIEKAIVDNSNRRQSKVGEGISRKNMC